MLALTCPGCYAAQYPVCNILNGDYNGDGQVNYADIAPFVAALAEG